MEALGAAVVCCVLAKAGPQRSRVLANLYKDERTAGLPTFPFMEKVYLERVLRPDEVLYFTQLTKSEVGRLPYIEGFFRRWRHNVEEPIWEQTCGI